MSYRWGIVGTGGHRHADRGGLTSVEDALVPLENAVLQGVRVHGLPGCQATRLSSPRTIVKHAAVR
jgi:hypothetical protein